MKSKKQRTIYGVLLGTIWGLFGPLGVWSSTASAQKYVFGRADFAAGVGPRSLVTGDFNGDGKLDLAVAGPSTGTVSILLGNGDGTFQPHVDYGTGNVPVWVTTGDFNGDGKLDLAIPDFAVDKARWFPFCCARVMAPL